MTRPIDVYMMVGIPVALAMVLVVVLFSGRMKPEARTRIERGMAAVFYPMVTVFWLWKAYDFAGQGDWLRAVLMIGVAIVFGWMGVRAFRAGRLAPSAGGPA